MKGMIDSVLCLHCPEKHLSTTLQGTVIEMRPVPLSAYIPPVTGTGGRPGNVTANSFDSSNLFPYPRPRANSKRMRTDDDLELNRRFDLTRDFPPLIFPEKQGVDADAVSALLVGAAAAVPAIRAKMESPDVA